MTGATPWGTPSPPTRYKQSAVMAATCSAPRAVKPKNDLSCNSLNSLLYLGRPRRLV